MTGNKQQKYQNPFIATFTGIRDQFRNQIQAGELKPSDRLDGKRVFVDGASSGLGFAVAREVAERGARVIMACRSGIPEKGEMIKRLSGNEDITMMHVDYSDLHSIEKLVCGLQEFSPSCNPHPSPPVDILILNAGVVPNRSRKTPQGFDEMFMVNFFSKFILVQLMIEKGLLNSVSRIVFVSSESHRNPKQIRWETFGKYVEYGLGGSMEQYGYNKLLLTIFTRELSRRLNPGTEVTRSVFAMCPGPVNSNIARETPKIFQPLLRLVFSIFFKSPEKAAIPVIYLAASRDLKGKAYQYLFQMGPKEIDEKAADPENGKKLWELSEKLLEEIRK